MGIHLDYSPIKGCRHSEWTFGEICVKCNECGRYDVDYKCVNCGYTKGKKSPSVYADWGEIEFIDVFTAPICPKCKPLFKNEDRTQAKKWWDTTDILCYLKDFERR